MKKIGFILMGCLLFSPNMPVWADCECECTADPMFVQPDKRVAPKSVMQQSVGNKSYGSKVNKNEGETVQKTKTRLVITVKRTSRSHEPIKKTK